MAQPQREALELLFKKRSATRVEGMDGFRLRSGEDLVLLGVTTTLESRDEVAMFRVRKVEDDHASNKRLVPGRDYHFALLRHVQGNKVVVQELEVTDPVSGDFIPTANEVEYKATF